MPTVIDSLIVELGLDPSQFEKEQKNVSARLAGFKNQTRRDAKEAEEHLKSIADSFEALSRKAIAYVGSFLSIRSLTGFATQMVETNRQLGVLADTTQESVVRLSTLGNVFERMGASSQGVYQIVTEWDTQQKRMDAFMMSPQDSSLLRFLNLLGRSPYNIRIADRDASGAWKKPLDILVEVSEKIKASGMNPRLASTLLKDAGFDQETTAAILRSGEAVRQLFKEQEKIGVVTDAQRKKTDELRKAWVELNQRVKSLGQIVLEWLSDGLLKTANALNTMFDVVNRALADPKSVFYLPSVSRVREFFGSYGAGGSETGVDADERQRGGSTSGTKREQRPKPSGQDSRRTGVEDTGQSGANYMQGKPFSQSDLTQVETPYGRITVHKDAATDFKNFYDYLNRNGAPLKRLGSFNDRPKRWGGGKSMHGYGIANDLDDQLYLSPEMRQWIIDNPDKWRQALKDSRMRWGGDWKSVYDPGHVEWAGPDGKPNNQQGGGWPRTIAPATMPFPTFRSPIELKPPTVQNNSRTDINSVNVNTQADNAAAIAGDIAKELKRQMRDSQAEQQQMDAAGF